MSVEIRIPRLGWSMERGTLVEWLKREGDRVRRGDPLFVLEGDKAAQEVEALDEGVLWLPPDGPQPGDPVEVGQLVGFLVAEGEETPFQAASAVSTGSLEAVPEPEAVEAMVAPPLPERREEGPGTAAAPVSTPRARRAARELGVDWTTVAGSGRGGRVRERDVRAAAARGLEPVSSVRRTIAARMLESLRTTAPVTLTTRADATHLVSLRNQFKAARTGEQEVIPSITDLVIKLLARALHDHPSLNSRREGDSVRILAEYHIGIAVETDAGLVVPVIRDVPALGVRQLAARSRALIEKARTRRLAPDDLRGGTFTVTNLGMFGIDAFTPIINPPETAVLGLGAIRREPVSEGADRWVPRDLMTLSLTFDHQVVDGAPAARFLRDLSGLIQNAGAWLVG